MNERMKQCYLCKGTITIEAIRHFHQWGNDVVLFENLRVEKCSQCGEVFLEPSTLEMIDRKTQEVLSCKAEFTSMSIPVVAA